MVIIKRREEKRREEKRREEKRLNLPRPLAIALCLAVTGGVYASAAPDGASPDYSESWDKLAGRLKITGASTWAGAKGWLESRGLKATNLGDPIIVAEMLRGDEAPQPPNMFVKGAVDRADMLQRLLADNADKVGRRDDGVHRHTLDGEILDLKEHQSEIKLMSNNQIELNFDDASETWTGPNGFVWVHGKGPVIKE